MTVKLFQDVAGTIPAVLPGQPVGFIKRTKGSDDARQATALSKPTYARWPKTGRRNLLNRSVAIVGGGWGITAATYENLSLGVMGVLPCVKVVSNSLTYGRLVCEATQYDVDSYSITVVLKRGSSPSARVTVRSDVFNTETNLTLTFGTGSFIATSTGSGLVTNLTAKDVGDDVWILTFVINVVTAGLMTVGAGPNSNTSGEYVIVAGAQVERGSIATPLQFNYGPNDITEAGIPDLWHLYNDGNDSLNVTLPAGTYGLASIGIDRQIVIGTFVSDGTTPINILRHERQLDVSYRLGAYSAAEELAIRDAWGRKYA